MGKKEDQLKQLYIFGDNFLQKLDQIHQRLSDIHRVLSGPVLDAAEGSSTAAKQIVGQLTFPEESKTLEPAN